MKIVHDLSRCASTGMCEAVAPELFQVTADGVLVLLNPTPPEASRALVEEAVDACPTQALRIED